MASPSSICAAASGTFFIPGIHLTSTAGSSSSSSSSSWSSSSSSSCSCRTSFLPLRKTFTDGCSIKLVTSTRQHLFVAQCATQAEAKEVEDPTDSYQSDSDYESSDEENGGSAPEQTSPPGVEALLQKYKEALSSNEESVLAEVGAELLSMEKEKAILAQQVSTLNEEVSSAKERLLRLNADFDNFRKRSEKERKAVSTNVKGDVVNSLLPMIDNFERAKTQIKLETDGEQKIDSSYQGIYKQFVEIMKSLGVSVVETVGKEFDPNVHEAIMREESSDRAEGVIIEEFRRGFMLEDKLLRPAMVKVSSGPPTPSAGNVEAAAEPAQGSGTVSVSEGNAAE